MIVDVIPTTDKNAVLNLNAIAVLVIWLIGVALLVIVHVAFAFAIAYDAGNLPQGRKPYFAGKTVWFLGILLGGPILAGIYWVMHHSIICPFVYIACEEEIAFNKRTRDGTNSETSRQ